MLDPGIDEKSNCLSHSHVGIHILMATMHANATTFVYFTGCVYISFILKLTRPTMNPQLEYESTSLLREDFGAHALSFDTESRGNSCLCSLSSCMSVDLCYVVSYFIGLTGAIVCSCIEGEMALLIISLISICISMRFSCLFVAGAFFVIFMNNWDQIKQDVSRIHL
jgi:hypothetical protein